MVQEERALAVRQAAALVERRDEEEGDFGIPDEELRAPWLKWSGKFGKFTDTVTGEVSESASLVLLRRLPASRIYWNRDTKAKEKLLCRSIDMVYPVDIEAARQLGAGPTCDGCKFAEFGRDEQGNTTKSPCSEYLNLAVAHADDDEPIPYVLAVRSTSLKPIRKLLQQLSWLRVAKRVKQIPGYALRFKLFAGPIAGTGAEQYFPLAAAVEKEMVDADRLPQFAALWRVVSHSVIDVTAEAVPDSEDEPATDYGPEPHVMSADELRAQMNDETRQARERMQAQAAARSAKVGDLYEPESEQEDCHSLPAEPEGNVDESWFEPPAGQAQGALMDVPAQHADPVDGRRTRR